MSAIYPSFDPGTYGQLIPRKRYKLNIKSPLDQHFGKFLKVPENWMVYYSRRSIKAVVLQVRELSGCWGSHGKIRKHVPNEEVPSGQLT